MELSLKELLCTSITFVPLDKMKVMALQQHQEQFLEWLLHIL
jgi:hypothetical protein